MKRYLFFLFCCFSIRSFGQNTPNSIKATFAINNIQFKSAGVTLEGAIFKPKHTVGALVIVHGSGQVTRMNDLASILAKNGIAVLTYDKRGVGKSGGVYAGPEVGTNNVDSSNLDLLALDASAAIDELSMHLKSKHLQLGLMGFSQATWVIPLAAKKNPKVKFMTLFSGPITTTLEQLRFQFYTAGNSNFWETHTEAEARQHIKNDPDKYKFEPTDPREALAKLTIPGLWIYGGRDIQAPRLAYQLNGWMNLKLKTSPMTINYFQNSDIILPSQNRKSRLIM